jgi:hypothetical protein
MRASGPSSARTDLGRATVRAWRLLSVAIWLYLLGDAIQLFYEVVLHQRPDPTWADAAYLAFYPVALPGTRCSGRSGHRGISGTGRKTGTERAGTGA